MNFGNLSNITAFIAVIFYILSLSPSLVKTIRPSWHTRKWNLFLIKNRRNIGIAAFIFAAIHGLIIIYDRNVNFLLLESWIKYFQGIVMSTIMFLLAVTSNDFSLHKLKRNWKKLHNLTFIILIILPWHIWDKMFGHWTWFTPVALILTLGCVAIELFRFFVRRV